MSNAYNIRGHYNQRRWNILDDMVHPDWDAVNAASSGGNGDDNQDPDPIDQNGNGGGSGSGNP